MLQIFIVREQGVQKSKWACVYAEGDRHIEGGKGEGAREGQVRKKALESVRVHASCMHASV
jgi:hypothetical protein